MDPWHKITNLIDHNRFTFIAVVIAAGIWSAAYGMEAKTTSPLTGKEVTRSQLDLEINGLQTGYEMAYSDLDKQDEFRVWIADTLGGVITAASPGTPIGGAAIAGSLINMVLLGGAVGLGSDRIRTNSLVRAGKLTKVSINPPA